MQNIINFSSILLNLLPIGVIISAIFTITSRVPIVSIIGLISVFIQSAIYVIVLAMDFIGLSYLIIYVGECLEWYTIGDNCFN
jgi:NADH-ubiquinone oxidoreductase chain 6